MLCPEVWNFAAPSYSMKFSEGNCNSPNAISNTLKKQGFNHSVSVVLPDTLLVPESLMKLLSKNCDYYKVQDFPLTVLLQEEFLNSFIRSASLTALSIETRIDCDNCLAITSSGHLVLSLLKEFYEEFGIEGKLSAFCRKKGNSSRYKVIINLKDLDPKSKSFQRISFAFRRFQSKHKFSVVLAFEPLSDSRKHDESYVTSFLKEKGISATKCSPKFIQRRANNAKVPIMKWEKQDEGCDPQEVLEWLGLFSLECSLNGEDDVFVNSYLPLENTVLCGQTAYMQWTGFFTTSKIGQFLENLKGYVSSRQIPWAAIHVSGFEDSPVYSDLVEHRWYGAFADISYTIFFHSSGKFILYDLSSSQKLLKYQ